MKETVVVYHHHAEVSVELGWNTPEDYARVADIVVNQKAIVGAIIYERLPETSKLFFQTYGKTVASVDEDGKVTTY